MCKFKLGRKSELAILIIATLSFFLFPAGAAAKQEKSSSGSVRQANKNWQVTFNTGYRQDNLNWTIAGDINGSNPNILSELTWTDLDIFQMEIGLEAKFWRNFKLGGTLAYGFIFGGQNQDSDYLGDNRTLEFSRSNNSADGGNTRDISVAFGYEFLFGSGAFGFTPLFGYSNHVQNLNITDGVQTIPPLGPFPGLDSSYDAEWAGPWAGLDLTFRILTKGQKAPDHEFKLGSEYHFNADYSAEADWNLRTDFQHPISFEHEADGSGLILEGSYKIIWLGGWSLDFNGKYQEWQTDPGIDTVFFSDGTVAVTRLNEVNWDSYSLMIGFTFRW